MNKKIDVKAHKRFDPRIDKKVDVNSYQREQEVNQFKNRRISSPPPLIPKQKEITFEVSDLIARFFKEENIKGHFGEEYTKEMILEEVLRDAIKQWAGWTLEEEVEWMEKEDPEEED